MSDVSQMKHNFPGADKKEENFENPLHMYAMALTGYASHGWHMAVGSPWSSMLVDQYVVLAMLNSQSVPLRSARLAMLCSLLNFL